MGDYAQGNMTPRDLLRFCEEEEMRKRDHERRNVVATAGSWRVLEKLTGYRVGGAYPVTAEDSEYQTKRLLPESRALIETAKAHVESIAAAWRKAGPAVRKAAEEALLSYGTEDQMRQFRREQFRTEAPPLTVEERRELEGEYLAELDAAEYEGQNDQRRGER